MLKTIALKDIPPNRFNIRQDYNPEATNELAEELEDVGLWVGSLRERMHNGRVELCFGHRRWMALKKLHQDVVTIDILDLTDEQMMEQGLIENLQRQGLNDMEKAEGIRQLVDLQLKN